MVGRRPLAAVAIPLLAIAVAAWPIRAQVEVNGDGRLAAAYALVDHGSTDLDRYVAQRPAIAQDLALSGDRHVLAKPVLPTLLIAVPYAITRLVQPPARIDDPYRRWAVTVAVSGAALALAVLLVARLAGAGGGSAGPAFVALAATPLLVYSAYLFSHLIAAVLLLAALLAALRGGRAATALVGLITGALYATETLMLAAAAPLALYAAWRARGDRAALAAMIAAAVAGSLPQLAWQWIAFGSPLAEPNEHLVDPIARAAYADPAAGSSPLSAVGQLLFSPSYGIALYAPAMIAGAWLLVRSRARDRRAAILSLACALTPIGALVLLAPGLVEWHDRAQYGPRTILAVAPLLVWPLATIPRRRLALLGALAAVPHVLAHVALDPMFAPSAGAVFVEVATAIPRGAAASSIAGRALSPWLGVWSDAYAAAVFAVVVLAALPVLAGAVGRGVSRGRDAAA